VVLHKEMFLEPTSDLRDAVFSKSLLDFAYCANGMTSEKQELTIKNKLKIPITAYWPTISNELGES
jgi:hypothetical protein